MKLKNILALFLALIIALALCACSAEDAASENSEPTTAATGETNAAVEDDEPPVAVFEEDEYTPGTEDTKPTVGEYIVYVIDEEGTPQQLVEVKFIKASGDTVVKTNEDGMARLITPIEDVDDVTAALVSTPEGYVEDTYTYGFDPLSLELTITLKNA